MIFLIHALEVALLLLVSLLVYRVFKAYSREHQRVRSAGVADETVQTVQTVQANSRQATFVDGKSIVEAYIDDLLTGGGDSTQVLAPLQEAQQAKKAQRHLEPTSKVEPEGCDRSISGKVMGAMMAEAELLCAS